MKSPDPAPACDGQLPVCFSGTNTTADSDIFPQSCPPLSCISGISAVTARSAAGTLGFARLNMTCTDALTHEIVGSITISGSALNDSTYTAVATSAIDVSPYCFTGLNATLSSVDNATYQLSVLHAVANNISRALVLGTIGDDLIEFNEEGFSCPTSSFVDGLIGRSNELLDSLCFTCSEMQPVVTNVTAYLAPFGFVLTFPNYTVATFSNYEQAGYVSELESFAPGINASIANITDSPDGAIVSAVVSVPSILELSEFAQGVVDAYWGLLNASDYTSSSMAARTASAEFEARPGRGNSQGQFIISSAGFSTRSNSDFQSFFKMYFPDPCAQDCPYQYYNSNGFGLEYVCGDCCPRAGSLCPAFFDEYNGCGPGPGDPATDALTKKVIKGASGSSNAEGAFDPICNYHDKLCMMALGSKAEAPLMKLKKMQLHMLNDARAAA
ncbi:g6274 [Coccomyxa viridis]|uniref:G6274 protein n=1 Tax=Coccomyxa viridis TaxID=1274662 RepID=A0ABP1FUZ4_9CHLO